MCLSSLRELSAAPLGLTALQMGRFELAHRLAMAPLTRCRHAHPASPCDVALRYMAAHVPSNHPTSTTAVRSDSMQTHRPTRQGVSCASAPRRVFATCQGNRHHPTEQRGGLLLTARHWWGLPGPGASRRASGSRQLDAGTWQAYMPILVRALPVAASSTLHPRPRNCPAPRIPRHGRQTAGCSSARRPASPTPHTVETGAACLAA